MLKTLQAEGDQKYKVIIAGYLVVFLAVALALTLGDAGQMAPFAVGLVVVCIVASLGLFGANHLRLAVENHRLSREGEHLDQKAHSDPLTGLMNRVAFNNVLTERSQAHSHGELAILFFDLNRFKEINDSLGHKAGDMLLAEVATVLTENLPGAVAVARMGGDEFAAILPLSDSVTPEGCATAIANALRQPLLLEGQLVQSGAAIGIAYGNLAYDDGDDLLKRADMAMYEAKAAGLNSYRVFDDVMEERMTSRVNIRAELTRALDSDELTLNYQPLVSARTGELKSVEALLRWNSPRLGNVSPGVLIPIAEESGQIIELSHWVLDKALHAIKTLVDVPVGINISPVHFRHNQFATMVADKLLAANIRPELLYIEITEGVLISHMDAAKKTITQLRNLGIKVYLDDFGTGYSSLSYLQNFEFDGMKIDKSFLRNLGERQQATQIMRSVIDLGHSLNLQVVAEGIESDWQARLLQLLNCDILQGFHFATPMSLEAVQEFRAKQADALAETTPAAVAAPVETVAEVTEPERLAG
ncbi:MAG: EAL domain-containing protein [Brevundimonas sp.]|nr:MAG: EAL domain-containing protein [Brevundimonas sp.]